MTNAVIIVAGGTGTRMNTDIPKQFILLAGKPVIVHTINRFLKWDSDVRICVVIHPDYVDHWIHLKDKYFPTVVISHALGGKNRFDSVKNGLALVQDTDVIGVHDAARPLVALGVIEKCFSAAMRGKTAIPIIPVYESLRHISGDNSSVVNRNNYALVQTPQCFHSEILHKAYEQPFSNAFTDDASVVESLGETIHLVKGNKENIKITESADLVMAEALLNS